MLLSILDAKLKRVGFIDSEPNSSGLEFYNDTWSRYLSTGSATFDFTVDKRNLNRDTTNRKIYQTLNERSFVSFRYKNKQYLFNIMKTTEDEESITCYCENLNLELLNEISKPYKAEKALSFVEYLSVFGLNKDFSALKLGVNEVSDKKLTLEWTGEETKLKRLLLLANNFDAEIAFDTYLNNDSSLKEFRLNVYREHDDSHQGVGRKRNDIVLEYGEEIEGISRTIDKTTVFNLIKGEGKEYEITEKVTKQRIVAKGLKYQGGSLVYAGHALSEKNIKTILSWCIKYKVLPSGVISQLYLESYWGESSVGRKDNNWAGMTGGAQTRPSGVKVTTGSARPASEGGTYMHYASADDFLQDYMYLLAKQNMYNVVGKDNIADYTKGLFRVGGAAYDYAAAGYASYNNLMTSVKNGINKANGNKLDQIDAIYRKPPTITTTSAAAPKTEAALNNLTSRKGQHIGSGQCYALTALYSSLLGGPGLGGGVTGISGRIGGGVAAALIGQDYNWKAFGWSVVGASSANVKAGAIANIKANYGAPVYTGVYGHTVIIKAVSQTTVTVLEQNYAGRQFVEEHSYSLSSYVGAIQSLCYPPELASGKVVGGKTTTTTDNVEVTVENYTEDVKRKVKTVLDPKKVKEWKNANGEVEFKMMNGGIYAIISEKLYPAVLSGNEIGDNWISRDVTIDTESVDVLEKELLKQLKANCYPKVTYEVKGFADAEPGDTFKARDDQFWPILLLEMRASEVHMSFTEDDNNRTVFTNFKELQSKVSADLLARMEEMAEAAKSYEIRVSSDKGVIFKNHLGRSVITPTLYRSGKAITDDVTWRFSLDGNVETGLDYTVEGTAVEETSLLTISAYIGDTDVAMTEITLVNVMDGTLGEPGENGTIVHVAWANSADGQEGFDLVSDVNKIYRGEYVDRIEADSTDPTKYKWVKVKGEQGERGDKGNTGNGIANVVTYFLATTASSGVTRSTSGWTTTVQLISASKRYLWSYRVENYTDGTSKTTEPAIIGTHGLDGASGRDGIAGKDGVGLKSTVVTYGLSASSDTQPPTWTSNVPGLVKGQYLWTKTVWGYTDNTSETGYQTTYIAKDGNSGKDGIPGKDGVGIRLTTVVYAGSTSGTVPPTSGWSSQIPRVSPGQYLWTKTTWSYTDNTSETGFSVAKMGETGEKGDKGDRGETGAQGIQGLQGPKGDQGIPGVAGKDGRTQYTHIAYADNATGGGFSQTDQTKAYIGMYQDFNATDSTNPTVYLWTKWKGDKGDTGAQGVPGQKGADGKTPYIHFAYSDNADGTGLTTSDNGQRYIGHYSDYTQTDSTDKTKYRWADRWAKIEVGGRNLFLNSKFNFDLNKSYSTYYVDRSNEQTQGQLAISIDTSTKFKNANTLKIVSTFNGTRNNQKITFRTGGDERLGTENEMSGKSVMMSFWAKSTVANTSMAWRCGYRNATQELLIGTDWKYYSFQLTAPLSSNATNEAILHIFSAATVWIALPKVEIGTISTDYTEAPEDVQSDINSKADYELTQQQINAINAERVQREAQLKAEALEAAVAEWVTKYQELMKSDLEKVKQSEAKLVEASKRAIQVQWDLNGMKQRWIDQKDYIDVTGGAIILGKNGNNAQVKITKDRISMSSSGKEVMWIEQNMLHIENGVFVKTLQIGHFQWQEYESDADMLVLRYVGGF